MHIHEQNSQACLMIIFKSMCTKTTHFKSHPNRRNMHDGKSIHSRSFYCHSTTLPSCLITSVSHPNIHLCYRQNYHYGTRYLDTPSHVSTFTVRSSLGCLLPLSSALCAYCPTLKHEHSTVTDKSQHTEHILAMFNTFQTADENFPVMLTT